MDNKKYLTAFSEKELADIAEFYKSSSGKALIRKTPELMAYGSKVGEMTAKKAFPSFKAKFARDLEASGVVVTKTKSMQRRLIDLFR